jgi:hypothetical protein
VDTSNRTQACLAARARSLAAPGMTLTPPGRSSGSREPRTLHSRELHSRYTPSVASKAGPIKSCHKYQELGTGGFGTVYKVVDLSSGELWAVKEIVSTNSTGLTGQINRLRISLVHEVETMAKLSHVSTPFRQSALLDPGVDAPSIARQSNADHRIVTSGAYCTLRNLPRLPHRRFLSNILQTIRGQLVESRRSLSSMCKTAAAPRPMDAQNGHADGHGACVPTRERSSAPRHQARQHLL